jgi:hypothetical protein
MLTFAPPAVNIGALQLPDSDLITHEALTVPAGGGTSSALKCGYDRPNEAHFNGLFVNNSSNTAWLLFVAPEEPAPSRDTVLNQGARLNANGSTFVIPDKTVADIYFATSATSSVSVRGIYFSRGGF